MCNFFGEKFLGKVANAAHEHGYVGEVRGALKGDRVRATHRLFQGLSHVLNKNAAMQLATFSRNSWVPLALPVWQGSSRPRE